MRARFSPRFPGLVATEAGALPRKMVRAYPACGVQRAEARLFALQFGRLSAVAVDVFL
jgi:hypothetical protein